jgi:tetratricopeptide (TPR) repeat protein
VLDKRKANVWVKVVALVIAVAFVAYYALLLIQASPGGAPSAKAKGQTTYPEDDPYLALISQHSQLLKNDPKNPSLMLQVGNDYFDLANEQGRATPPRQVMAQSNFRLAADTYGRYLALKPKDLSARTDRSIAMFYAGDTNGAIAEIKKVLTADPKFEQGLFNLGIFYANAGDSTNAKAVWGRYLDLYPKGQAADWVKQQLVKLNK